MVARTYRANLTAAEFPLLSELQGRTIIISDIDQNYSRQANSTRDKDRDLGIPQAYYMHNVVPIDAGLTSVGYQLVLAAPTQTESDNTFGDMFYLRNPAEGAAYLNATGSGKNYIFNPTNSIWMRTISVIPAAGCFVTTAHVNGQSYVYYGGVGCYKYTGDPNQLEPVTLIGLDPTLVKGICASNGYMVVWSDTGVYWSSVISEIDFTPSLATGAGGGGVQLAKAAIICCLPQNNGFVIYTKKNAIASSYSNNVQFPFSFREIIGAGGLSTPSLVAYDGNSVNHVAYTTYGLQSIGMQSASNILPAITDLLGLTLLLLWLRSLLLSVIGI